MPIVNGDGCMKKNLCFLASLCISASLCFASCDEKEKQEPESKFVGKWQCAKLISEGSEITDLHSMPMSVLMHLTINDDGSFIMESPIDESSSGNGTWTENGDVITVTFDINEQDKASSDFNKDDNIQLLEYKNGQLVAKSDSSEEFILEKVTEFDNYDSLVLGEDFIPTIDDPLQ